MVMTVVHGRCFLLSRTSTWPFLAVEEFFQSPPWYATVGRQLIAAVADADGEANWSRPQSDQTDHRESVTRVTWGGPCTRGCLSLSHRSHKTGRCMSCWAAALGVVLQVCTARPAAGRPQHSRVE